MSSTLAISKDICHNCGSNQLSFSKSYFQSLRVTSDCKPWPPGGKLALCLGCGLVQTIADQDWLSESERIYAGYDIYHQSGGVEQSVFNPATGQGRLRSAAIVEGLLGKAQLPTQGRLLDIGCGNGAFLRECSRALPGWKLCGSEFDLRHQPVVEAIPGVEKLYSGPLEEIPGDFDVISLIHVLEHIPAPTALLRKVFAKLKPGGRLLVEVPDCLVNPFMLLVADHASHFSPGSLTAVVSQAGFEVLQADDSWVPKEISLLARKPEKSSAPARECPPAEAQATFGNWEFLDQIAKKTALLEKPFGILGTSIAATWLDAQTNRACSFFVDEDPHREGKQHQDRPIFSVAKIPPNTQVFLALPGRIAAQVATRLHARRSDVEFVVP